MLGKFASSNLLANGLNSDIPITLKFNPERFNPNDAPPYPAKPSNTLITSCGGNLCNFFFDTSSQGNEANVRNILMMFVDICLN